MLDTIIQLPNNLFYNTGITTYIWLVTNTKPEARRGRVQLIDANLMYRKLRKNLGDKNCEFAPEHIEDIVAAYTAFQPVERQLDANGDTTGIAVQIFDNTDFGYHKVTVERPDRRRAQFSAERLEPLRFDKSLREPMEHLGQWDLSKTRMREIPVLLPPLPEQRTIAAFLNVKCAKVDEAVRIKEEEIALLRERRQILIHQAVTRGLNLDVPLRDSGIDWIGQIPAHWEVKRAKFLFREVNERSNDGSEELLSVSHTTGV